MYESNNRCTEYGCTVYIYTPYRTVLSKIHKPDKPYRIRTNSVLKPYYQGKIQEPFQEAFDALKQSGLVGHEDPYITLDAAGVDG